MLEADKDKIRKAFRDAVANNPKADEPIREMTIAGKHPSYRELIENTLASPELYSSADAVIKKDSLTVEQFIDKYAPKFPSR